MGNDPKNPQNADVFGIFINPYMNLFNVWQKNVEAFSQALNPQNSGSRDGERAGGQAGGMEVFRYATEQQLEFFRFIGRRWEQYIEFLASLSRCRSPAEATQLQSAFLSKLASDIGMEGRRFAEQFPEFFATVTAGRAVSLPQERRYSH